MTAGKMEVRRLGLHLFSCPTRCGISGDHVRCQRRREQSRQRSSSVRRRLHEGQATGKGYGGPDVVCAGAGLAIWSSRRVRDERTTWSRSPTCFYSSLYSPDRDWRRGSRLRPLGKHCLDRRASGPSAGTSQKCLGVRCTTPQKQTGTTTARRCPWDCHWHSPAPGDTPCTVIWLMRNSGRLSAISG
jgi:hypothetical protein